MIRAKFDFQYFFVIVLPEFHTKILTIKYVYILKLSSLLLFETLLGYFVEVLHVGRYFLLVFYCKCFFVDITKVRYFC